MCQKNKSPLYVGCPSHFLPRNGSQVCYESAEIFGSYSVMVAACWKGENGTTTSVSATFGYKWDKNKKKSLNNITFWQKL